jgi:hypothetical protein
MGALRPSAKRGALSVAGRGAAIVVAFVLVSPPLAAPAGERGVAGGFQLLPLVAPRAAAARAAPAPAPRPVCVRQCDGYFFPLPAASGPTANADEEAACHALCPSMDVALYFLPAHSDRIEDAANARGEPYSALPAAFRYRSAGAPACRCRRAGEPGLAYWRDPTLKSGDAVMTAEGVVVFRGAVGGAPYDADAFTSVDAAAVGAARRAELGALTPASAPEPAESAESAAPGIGEARRAASATTNEIRFLETRSGGGG